MKSNNEQKELILMNGVNRIKVLAGSKQQELSIIIDILRPYSLVISNNNSIKNHIGYKYQISSSFSFNSNNKHNIQYNNKYLAGYSSSDKFSFSSFELNNYSFYLIDQIIINNIIKYDGTLGIGFSRNNSTFISQYTKNYLINNSVIGLLIKGKFDEGLLHIGFADKKIINNHSLSNITYASISFPNDDDNDIGIDWYILSEKLKFHNTKEKIIINSHQKLIFDTTISVLQIPMSFFFSYMDRLFPNDAKCQMNQDDLFHCYCDNKLMNFFPSFYFYVYDNALHKVQPIEITAKEYIKMKHEYPSYATSFSDSNCYLAISINYSNDYWIIGTNIINNYYLIFDYENQRLGLYKYQVNNSNSFILLFILLVILSISAFVMILSLVFKLFIAKKNQANVNDHINDDDSDEEFAEID